MTTKHQSKRGFVSTPKPTWATKGVQPRGGFISIPPKNNRPVATKLARNISSQLMDPASKGTLEVAAVDYRPLDSSKQPRLLRRISGRNARIIGRKVRPRSIYAEKEGA